MLYFDKRSLEVKFFPNRELYVETGFLAGEDRGILHTLTLRFENNDDLMALYLVKSQMDDMGFTHVELRAPFFPYSTMDHTDNTRPLSLKAVSAFINGMNFERVQVMEPHSSALNLVVDRLDVIDKTHLLLYEAMKNCDKSLIPVICFPDAGAVKRYESMMSGPHNYLRLEFNKRRSFQSGKIEEIRCLDNTSMLGPNHACFIVDDLCRGGRTFTACGDVLKQAGAGFVILCVTHLEMGAFKGVLQEGTSVDLVYATDSCLPENHPTAEKLRLTSVYH